MPRKAKRDSTYNPDWAAQADAARAEAAKLPEGPAKEKLLKLARQLDTAAHIKEWLSSPGLMRPSE